MIGASQEPVPDAKYGVLPDAEIINLRIGGCLERGLRFVYLVSMRMMSCPVARISSW